MKKNIFAGIMVALVLIGGASVAAPSASALTVDEIQAQIKVLLAKVAELTTQMNTLQGSAGVSGGASGTVSGSDVVSAAFMPSRHRVCEILNRNLSFGMQGDDVRGLQEFLNSEGYFSASATGYFGPITSQAVARWQASQGVQSVGAVGPMTRERIRVWCGNPPPPTCKPINYTVALCSDGSTPQPTHDANNCITGYECPVANFTPPANCKAWYDGCNNCARTSPDVAPACTLRACFAAGKGYCTAYFDTQSTNQPPSISSFSGPTTLAVNVSGTWTIQASDPENQQLSYHVTWGDEYSNPVPYASMMGITPDAFVQTTTFTHAYAYAGTYTVTILVHDTAGKEAKTSTTVKVTSTSVVCTTDYAPVCGQPPEPACRHSIPACMIATPGPQTYSNRCMLDAAGATFLHSGQCSVATSASCITPWGGLIVANGAAVSSQPYFSNGIYSMSITVPQRRCSNSTWLTCDYQGNNCS